MPDLLLEIGLEEVPARMIASAEAELLKRTLALLTRERLIDPAQLISAAHSYSTPRRLAVLVHDVLPQQPDITEDTTGPAVKIAFKDGLAHPRRRSLRPQKVRRPRLRPQEHHHPQGRIPRRHHHGKGRTAPKSSPPNCPKRSPPSMARRICTGAQASPSASSAPSSGSPVCSMTVSFPFNSPAAPPAAPPTATASSTAKPPSPSPPPPPTSPSSNPPTSWPTYELRRHNIRKALDRATRKSPTPAGAKTTIWSTPSPT